MGIPNKLYAKIKISSKNTAHNSLILTEKITEEEQTTV